MLFTIDFFLSAIFVMTINGKQRFKIRIQNSVIEFYIFLVKSKKKKGSLP